MTGHSGIEVERKQTGATVAFGDSTDDEMCVLGMYRYPATGAVSLCSN